MYSPLKTLPNFEEWQKKRRDKEVDDQKEEENAKKLKEDDVTTWTGKRLAGYEKKPGHLTAAVKRNAEQSSPIVDGFQPQEPVKKKPKAGGFGNFSGW